MIGFAIAFGTIAAVELVALVLLINALRKADRQINRLEYQLDEIEFRDDYADATKENAR